MWKEIIAFIAMAQATASGVPQPDTTGPTAKPTANVVRTDVRLTADQVVDRVQEFYDGTNRLTARFGQQYTNTVFGRVEESRGKVFLLKPGKMRWDYHEGKTRKQVRVARSFIADGKTFWGVEHDNKQVFKKNLEKDLLPVAVAFLFGKGNLTRDFTAEIDLEKHKELTAGLRYDSGAKQNAYVLKLTPKLPSAQYKTLWLVVHPANYRVQRSVILEASGNTNQISFYEPSFTRAVKREWFKFDRSKHRSYKLVEADKAKPRR